MKKVFTVVIVTISVGLFCVAGYFGYKSYLQKRNPIDVVSQFAGEVKERRQYIFQAPKVKNSTVLVDADTNPRTIQLYLGNGKSYSINIPANDVVLTDYSTYIYNADNSYAVQVVKGVTKDNMENMFSMKNTEKLTHTIIKTKEGKKEPQAVGILLVDDIGVVATCYDNPVAFATLLDGVEINRIKDVKYNAPTKVKDCQEYSLPSQIPISSDYPFTVSPNEFNSAGTKQYNFEDGQLTQFAIMLGFDDAIEEMYNRVNVAKFGEVGITAICFTEGTRYIELGDFTILVNSKTVNKSNCFLGQGKEARYNIVTYYRQYCK